MEMFGMCEESSNVIYLSSLVSTKEDSQSHKCGYKCGTEHVWGNIYKCKVTGINHICDKNCDQRIVYDNYNSICRVSRQMFPLSDVEMHAVRSIVRKRTTDDGSEGCSLKRRRHFVARPSPFERSFSFATPICGGQVGDSMEIN